MGVVAGVGRGPAGPGEEERNPPVRKYKAICQDRLEEKIQQGEESWPGSGRAVQEGSCVQVRRRG